MKLTRKIFYIVIAVGVCVALAFFIVKASNRQDKSQPPVCSTVGQKSGIASTPFRPTTNTVLPPKPLLSGTTTNAFKPPVEQNVLSISAVPTEIGYKPIVFINRREELIPVLSAVSNAVLTVDQILRSKEYKVHEFSRTKWLVAEDKAHAMVWKIFPYYTNATVGSVEAVAFQDKAMTQKDLSRSFEMSFYPDGTLRKFWWADRHEIIRVNTNESRFEYAKRLNGKIWLEMRWDKQGNLVSSNVCDWTGRGPVGVPQQAAKTPYRFGPTSAVEAATESWRQPKQ